MLPKRQAKVKFCGLTTLEEIETVNRLHPDFAGFVMASGSPRTIGEAQLKILLDHLDPSIESVLVCRGQSLEEMEQLTVRFHPDWLQIHDLLEDKQIRQLQKQIRIIQAFRITPEDFRQFSPIRNRIEACPADLILLDGPAAGSGTSFDWSLLKEISRPYLLAGGLDAGRVPAALSFGPWGLDVSSGIEKDRLPSPVGSRKDPEKMAAFLQAAEERNFRL